MGKYESYQQVNEKWFSQVPTHWETGRVKAIFNTRKERNNPVKTDFILSLTAKQGVVPYTEKEDVGGNKHKNDLTQYNIAHENDLLVNCMNIVSGAAGVSKYFGAISPVYYALYPRQNDNIWYFNYLFRLASFQRSLIGLGKGILMHESDNGKLNTVRMRISMDSLGNVLLPIPPRQEQDQIVYYLDWQTSKINRLIAAKKQQIQVLREQQQKLICEVITKGVHSGVGYKDSHIAWIGDIPSHWSAIRCKYLFRERDERSKEGTETHMSMSQKYGLVPDSQLDERRMLSESYAGGKLCYQDDLVLNRLKAHLGVFALAPQFGVISPDYTVLIPNAERIIPSFGEMVLKSALCRRELRVRVRGIIEGFWRLYTDDFYTIYLPVPPIEEQKEIMHYIDAQAKKVSAVENALNREIELLHELRTRLISDVVTGQIDVRSIEVPDFELVEEAADEAEEPEDEMEVE